MKSITCKTDKDGFTITGENLGTFTVSTDQLIGKPKNAIIKCKCSILENYREITEEEKKMYYPQEGIKIWSEDFQTFFDVIIFEEWKEDREYYVPINFEFKIKELTDEDAKKRPKVIVWDDDYNNREEGYLIGVEEGEIRTEYPYYIINKKGIDCFSKCKLKEKE